MKKLLIISIILLSACSDIKEGIVEEKVYEPENWFMTIIPIYTGKSMIPFPYNVYDGEDFIIRVRGINSKGDTIIKSVYVSPERYNSISIGDSICIENECLSDNNNIKEKK